MTRTRMTLREKGFVDHIDEVLKVIGSLQPSNPADLKAKIANLDIATNGAKLLHRAIVAWRSGDQESAGQLLTDAARLVAAPVDLGGVG